LPPSAWHHLRCAGAATVCRPRSALRTSTRWQACSVAPGNDIRPTAPALRPSSARRSLNRPDYKPLQRICRRAVCWCVIGGEAAETITPQRAGGGSGLSICLNPSTYERRPDAGCANRIDVCGSTPTDRKGIHHGTETSGLVGCSHNPVGWLCRGTRSGSNPLLRRACVGGSSSTSVRIHRPSARHGLHLDRRFLELEWKAPSMGTRSLGGPSSRLRLDPASMGA
jgi:hypothetical protein